MQNMVMPPVYSNDNYYNLAFYLKAFKFMCSSLHSNSLSLSGLIHHFTAHMTANGLNFSAQFDIIAGAESTQNFR